MTKIQYKQNDTPPSVFSVPIEGIDIDEIVDRISHTKKTPYWIVTANPEILLAAQRDLTYAETLKRADVRLVDGFGLWTLLRLFGHHTHRVTGVELAESMIQFGVQNNLKIAFFGGEQGIAKKAADATQRVYPSAILYAEHGGTVAQDGSTDARGDEAIARVTQWAPDILFVAFGHPKQERWIERYKHTIPSLKAVVGIGGALDYWAGKIRRAPRWMHAIGLEWVWRLIHEPSRMRRIVNAVIVFPLIFLKEKATQNIHGALK